jgi:hypothetical protein
VKGRWQIFWLEGEEERTLDLDEGDVLNVPIGTTAASEASPTHPMRS